MTLIELNFLKKYAPSNIIQIIKSITAKNIFKKLHNFVVQKITGNS